MKYFLFLNHPKKDELLLLSEEKEVAARRFFDQKDTIESEVVIKGKVYNAIIDYEAFANLANFDCFNCVEHCCGDNPSVYEENTRKFVLENIDRYNELTMNEKVLLEEGFEETEIKEMIENGPLMMPEEFVDNEITTCTCAFKLNNSTTLCSLHSICLEKNLTSKDIIKYKPIICSLWPMEIICEDDLSKLYITLPDDFTNSFTIENYYTKSCINIDYAESAIFKRENPKGFNEDDFIPFISAYKDTIIHGLGENTFNIIKEKLLIEEFLEETDFDERKQQIEIECK